MIAKDMDKIVTEILSEDTKKMLMNLNRYLTDKTECINVPDGTKNWKLAKRLSNGNGDYTETIVIIKLVPFFGLMVGYNRELDVLVFWKK